MEVKGYCCLKLWKNNGQYNMDCQWFLDAVVSVLKMIGSSVVKNIVLAELK